jgi:hypothetical protein
MSSWLFICKLAQIAIPKTFSGGMSVMNKRTLSMLALAGTLSALPAFAANQIDWSMVPGSHGTNDVSRDFIQAPNPFNEILSNNYTAWDSKQLAIDQSRTSTGRAQRRALLGVPHEEVASNEFISYDQNVVTTQAAPSRESQPGYSENTESSTKSGAQNVEKSKTDAQANLAPHALIMQTSLNSAMAQVKGIRGELDLTKDKQTDSRAMMAYRSLIHEMKNDINVARSHERQLINQSRKYPEIAKSSDLKDMPVALNKVETCLRTIESKAGSQNYWKNQTQAKADIDQLQSQLNEALNKVQSFSSSELNASIG